MTKKLMAAAVALVLLASGCGDDGGATEAGSPSPGDLGDVADSANDILDGLADGSLDAGDLDDLMEGAQDMAESFGDPGSGTVSINGDTIEFTSEICFAGQGDFTIDGLGMTDDGTPVWVSIDQSTDSRAELAEFMGEDLIESVYGDADPIIDSSFSLDYGRTELFGNSVEGQPSYYAAAGTLGQDEMAMSIDGEIASGSGSARDHNFVTGEFDDLFPFTFAARCN